MHWSEHFPYTVVWNVCSCFFVDQAFSDNVGVVNVWGHKKVRVLFQIIQLPAITIETSIHIMTVWGIVSWLLLTTADTHPSVSVWARTGWGVGCGGVTCAWRGVGGCSCSSFPASPCIPSSYPALFTCLELRPFILLVIFKPSCHLPISKWQDVISCALVATCDSQGAFLSLAADASHVCVAARMWISV